MASSLLRAAAALAITATTLVLSVLCVAVVGATDSALGARILIAIVAPLLVLLNLARLAMLVYSAWVDAHDHSPRDTSTSQWRIPLLALRLADFYLGWNLAWALLLEVFWAWDAAPDHSTYLRFEDASARHNAWAAWISLIGNSFQIFNGVGFAAVMVVHTATVSITGTMTIINGMTQWGVIAVLAGQAYEYIKSRREGDKAKSGGSNAGASVDGPLIGKLLDLVSL